MIGGCFVTVGILGWRLGFAPKAHAVPALTQQWHEQVYSLDENETVRFIPPPYTPLRKIHPWEKQLGFVVYDSNHIYRIVRQSWAPWQEPMREWLRGGVLNLSWRWPPPPRPIGNVQAAVEFCAIGRWPDVVVAEELKDVAAEGDWMVRGDDTPFAQRMSAMESVLKFVTGRELVVKYQAVEQEVEDWSLKLEDHGPLKLTKDRVIVDGLVLVERKPQRAHQ